MYNVVLLYIYLHVYVIWYKIKMETGKKKKKKKKIFFSESGGAISKKLGIKHQWLKYYNVYINHDPVVTLTYFTTRST